MGLSRTGMAWDGGMLTDASGAGSDAPVGAMARDANPGALLSVRVGRDRGVEGKANAGWLRVDMRRFDILTMRITIRV
jgi:hypothetical protein